MIDWLVYQLGESGRDALSRAAFDMAGRLPAVVDVADLWRLYGLAGVAVLAALLASWELWRDPAGG